MKIYKYYFHLIFFWALLLIILPITQNDFLEYISVSSYFFLYFLAFLSVLNNIEILKNKIIKLLILWSIYISIINFINLSNSPLEYSQILIDTLWWPSIFIIFYSIFKNDFDHYYLNYIMLYLPYYIISIIFLVYLNIFYLSSNIFSSNGLIDFEKINSIFWVLLVIPFVFLFKKNIIKYFFLFISLVLIVISTKRSALIAVSLIIIFSIYKDLINSRKKIINLIYILIFLLVGYFSLLLFIKNSEINSLSRLSETNLQEESRYELMSESWKIFKSKNYFSIFFGSGHRGSAIDRGYEMLSKTAHNDFLEILYDYGVLGLLIYLKILLYFFKNIKLISKIDRKVSQSYLAAILIFIVMS